MISKERPQLYYPELDGLRFFAFLLVFLHHSPIYDNPISKALHEYGWIGVDLFLCVSGFLFAKLLITEKHLTGSINVRLFYIRRILRIWPIYYLMIAFAMIFTIWSDGWNSINSWHFLGLTTFTENIVSASTGYIHIPFLVTLWTISYEAQFYAAIPWLVRWLSVVSIKTQLTFFCGFLLLGNIIRGIFIHFQIQHPTIWVLPITHFEAILGGVMLGAGVFEKPLKKMKNWTIFLTSATSIFTVFLLPNFNIIGWELIFTYSLTGIGFTLLIYLITNAIIPIFGKLLQNQVLVYLGKISYGLYVYHITSQYFTHQISNYLGIDSADFVLYPTFMIVTSFLLTLAISTVSYKWIESPLLHHKKGYSPVQSRPV